MDRTPALDSRSKLMVLNDNSLRTICQKVKELNPKKIHLFKKILEEKTRNIKKAQHNWRYI